MLLIAVVAVGVMTWRARPRPVDVNPPREVAAAATTSSAASSAAGPPAGEATLVVAVAGKVHRPGVVRLPAGARVVDAVRSAGGPLPGVDLGLLNLARRLTDGELVVIGLVGPSGQPPPVDPAGSGADRGATAPGSVVPGERVNLNTATMTQLDGLPGVGPVLAQRIVDWRTAHGQFTTVDQLRDVSGIGDAKFAQLRDRVMV
jgi:competence protein ComEA